MIYTSVDFDGRQAADYTLLVQVGEHQHALAVLDDEQQLKFAASYDPSQAEEEIADILNLDFGKVKLAVSDSQYTFIPVEVFDEAQTYTYLRFIQDDGMGEPLVTDIAPLELKLLHQTSRIGVAPLETRFPQLCSYPAVQSLLCGAANYGKDVDGPLLIIDKQRSRTTICFFDSGKFIYSNDFEIAHVDDLTYYLLVVLHHLGIADNQPLLCISGDVTEGDEYHRRMLAYGRQVVWADSGVLTGIGVPIELMPHQHRFLTLLGLNLCG